MLTRRPPNRDGGFTLVELLIAISLTGLIVAPLTAAIIMMIRTTDNVTDRLELSTDAQLAAAYFAQDVQSIGVRDWGDSPDFPLKQSVELNAPASGAGALYPCGPAGTPTAIVRFAWEDPAGERYPTEPRISYLLRTVGGERQLHRISCDGNRNVRSDIVLARHVHPTQNPVVACRTAAGQTMSCTSRPPPDVVTMTLTLRAPSSIQTYTVTLVGQRRQT